MSDVLARICADKIEHIARRKIERPMSDIEDAARKAPPPRGFVDRLADALESCRYGLIAEIKKASPSRGSIRADFDVAALARAYERGGATCLSVVTDGPYFHGDDAYLSVARNASGLPVLRKDFMLDPYQVIEARALMADCILVIMAAVDDGQAGELCALAQGYGMDVLIEAHDRAEVERALRLESRLIGVNNRNLKTLSVNLATTEMLSGMVPAGRILVCESGLKTPDDLARMAGVGVRCFLIGEALMAQPDVEAATRAILAPRTERIHNGQVMA